MARQFCKKAKSNLIGMGYLLDGGQPDTLLRPLVISAYEHSVNGSK